VFVLVAALAGASYYSLNTAQQFAHELPKYSGRIRAVLRKYVQKAENLQKTTQDVLPNTEEGNKTAHTVVVQQQPTWTDYITKGFGSITDILFGLGFIPFLIYFMLSWQEHVRAATVMLFRMENRNTAYVTIGAISKMIRTFIVGNVIVGAFMSLVAIAAFGLMGLPYFYFIGIISGYVSLIPYLGVVLAMVPPLVAGIGQIHSAQVIEIVLLVVLLHLFALNVLYPKIVGGRVRLNPLAVTLSLLIWGWLWGAMGLILAVPITAAMKIVFDHVDSLRGLGAWLGE
jgi:predicted PurR-regulated permease PerM